MSTALATAVDPYILPLPVPGTPVVLPQWISSSNSQLNSAYQDPVWSLGPLIDNPSSPAARIFWKNCPVPLREQMKLLAWTMINGRLRPTLLQSRGPRARPRTSPTDMAEKCREWMRLARWLHRHRVTSLAACTDSEWRAYAHERLNNSSNRHYAEKICSNLTDMWAFDQLSARPAGISRPPWDTEGVDDFLPAEKARTGGENTTEPLDPQVLGPLLIWAIRFVDDFADDILAAWAENRRLTARAATNKATPEGMAELRNLLLPRIRSELPLPTRRTNGRMGPARFYIGGVTGASLNQIDRFGRQHGLSNLAEQRPGPCPLQIPVTGRVAGQPWREYLDFNEAANLMQQLGTAAAIVCLYLTGMRPQEVQGLRTGCCPDPEPTADGTPGRHLIRSHHYKNVTDDDGNHISAGEEREVPWTAITPVVHAIRVLERMVPEGELLFSATHHDFPSHRAFNGALKSESLNCRIDSFTAWANHEAQAQGLPDQVIPEDPHGRISTSRFRRSLAWHVARRPGGLVALAIQYGHMRTVLDARTSSGYGSRSRTGMHSVLDVETALAAADTAARLRDRVAAGEKISGPAARRALASAATTPRFEGRIVPATFAKKAAAFLARDGVVLYDNPDAFLICAFKQDNALCEPDPGATAPRQYACQSGCGNTVRTDTYARQMRERADAIDLKAAFFPQRLAERLRRNADNFRKMADAHDATAQTAEALT
ncbi:integrase [Streptomyces katsurahamanus]|uniref:Integrase n=1 Tax=Streptomyces katsurahamanus TaxID=2577098 RepID=A0ABW9NWQ2_9ACTN|nr:integrase [Streptomyces katsurahamanus]MQS37708.1 integrase [Streptomyces katsurahamanus]